MCLESESGGRDERMHILRVSRIARRAIRLAMIAAAVFARARVGFGRSARGHQHRDRDRRSRPFLRRPIIRLRQWSTSRRLSTIQSLMSPMGYHQRTHLTITTCTTIIAAAVAIDAVIQWLSGLDCFVLAFPVPQLHLAVGGNRQLG